MILQSLGVVVSIAGFNVFGVATTKYASAPQRSTVDTSRTVIIWLFFLCYQGDGHEDFDYRQLIGFVFLIFGTLCYNEIITLPFWGLNNFTKVNLAKQ